MRETVRISFRLTTPSISVDDRSVRAYDFHVSRCVVCRNGRICRERDQCAWDMDRAIATAVRDHVHLRIDVPAEYTQAYRHLRRRSWRSVRIDVRTSTHRDETLARSRKHVHFAGSESRGQHRGSHVEKARPVREGSTAAKEEHRHTRRA